MTWATREQKAFLTEYWEEHKKASDEGKLSGFWPVLYKAWFNAYPNTNNLSTAYDSSKVKPTQKMHPKKNADATDKEREEPEVWVDMHKVTVCNILKFTWLRLSALGIVL
jgi:hypothetical protein